MEKVAYACSHVFKNTRPILLVSREGGDWQFLCGGVHEADEIPHVVGINHLIERDSTLVDIMDLNEGWEAEREGLESPWIKTPVGSGH
jgi:hypothetical protein